MLTPIMFVGVLPLLVVASLPVNEEHVILSLTGWLVDPRTREVVARYEVSEQLHDEWVTLWTHNPKAEMPDVLAQGFERYMREAARNLRGGKLEGAKFSSAQLFERSKSHHTDPAAPNPMGPSPAGSTTTVGQRRR